MFEEEFGHLVDAQKEISAIDGVEVTYALRGDDSLLEITFRDGSVFHVWVAGDRLSAMDPDTWTKPTQVTLRHLLALVKLRIAAVWLLRPLPQRGVAVPDDLLSLIVELSDQPMVSLALHIDRSDLVVLLTFNDGTWLAVDAERRDGATLFGTHPSVGDRHKVRDLTLSALREILSSRMRAACRGTFSSYGITKVPT